MKELLNIRDIKNIQKLDSEYDLQKALLLDRKLRLLVKDNASLKPIRTKLRGLIQEYEEQEWSNSEFISDQQVKEADRAEQLVEFERRFVQRRKNIIRKRLKSYEMTQQDLGVLLGHNKSYISELINGVSKFSLKDLVVIHRVLKIDLLMLVPTFLQDETKERIKKSIAKINKPKLKLSKEDLLISSAR